MVRSVVFVYKGKVCVQYLRLLGVGKYFVLSTMALLHALPITASATSFNAVSTSPTAVVAVTVFFSAVGIACLVLLLPAVAFALGVLPGCDPICVRV